MSPLTLRRNRTEELDQTVPADLPDRDDERPFPGFVRVNLLPNRFLKRESVRRIKRWLLVGLILVLGVLFALWFLAQRDQQAAQAELETAEMEQTQLIAEVNQYSEVPRVFATAAIAQESLNTAMSREVRWAFLLNQLSFATPAGVTLTTVGGALSEEGPVQTSPGEVLPAMESVGTMTFAGTGNSFSEIAAWLDSLQTLKDYTYPFLTNSAKGDTQADSTTPVPAGGAITWESTANLSPNALSGRFGTPPPAADSSGSGSGSSGGGLGSSDSSGSAASPDGASS